MSFMSLGRTKQNCSCWFDSLLVTAVAGSFHLTVEVQRDVTQLLLDVTDNLAFCCGGEGVATLGQDHHQVMRKITAGQVQSMDGMGQRVALVDRHCVRHAVTAVLQLGGVQKIRVPLRGASLKQRVPQQEPGQGTTTLEQLRAGPTTP